MKPIEDLFVLFRIKDNVMTNQNYLIFIKLAAKPCAVTICSIRLTRSEQGVCKEICIPECENLNYER